MGTWIIWVPKHRQKLFHCHVRDPRLNVKICSCKQTSLPEQGTTKITRAHHKCWVSVCEDAFWDTLIAAVTQYYLPQSFLHPTVLLHKSNRWRTWGPRRPWARFSNVPRHIKLNLHYSLGALSLDIWMFLKHLSNLVQVQQYKMALWN